MTVLTIVNPVEKRQIRLRLRRSRSNLKCRRYPRWDQAATNLAWTRPTASPSRTRLHRPYPSDTLSKLWLLQRSRAKKVKSGSGMRSGRTRARCEWMDRTLSLRAGRRATVRLRIRVAPLAHTAHTTNNRGKSLRDRPTAGL